MSSKALDSAHSFVDDAQRHCAEQKLPAIVIDLTKANGFTDQRCGYKQPLAMPLNHTVASHSAHLCVRIVFGCWHAAGVGVRGGPVFPGGRDATQCLMRPLHVVMMSEALKITLLGCQVALWWLD